MTAELLPPQPDPDDPAHILALLPDRWHQQFLAEYLAGLDDAREVGQWLRLRALLHRWRLRATAYSDPGFDTAAQAARDARPDDLVPIPGWDDKAPNSRSWPTATCKTWVNSLLVRVPGRYAAVPCTWSGRRRI